MGVRRAFICFFLYLLLISLLFLLLIFPTYQNNFLVISGTQHTQMYISKMKFCSFDIKLDQEHFLNYQFSTVRPALRCTLEPGSVSGLSSLSFVHSRLAHPHMSRSISRCSMQPETTDLGHLLV